VRESGARVPQCGEARSMESEAPPEHAGWTVHLRDPSNRLDPQVVLTENSVSTSEQTAPSALGGEAPGTSCAGQRQAVANKICRQCGRKIGDSL